MVKVLINEAFKKHLLTQSPDYRKKVHQKFEYLEIGYWDGGLKVKKIKSIGGQKAIFEARLDRANRILFTLGTDAGTPSSSTVLVYVWGIVCHDDIAQKSRTILPENVPFLHFKPYHEENVDGAQLENLNQTYFTQEGITQKLADDSATQRWHFLDEVNWERIEKYRQHEFEMQLYLTPEQTAAMSKPLPILISGTAGSGKTTMGVYYLLHLPLAKRRKLFITYNRHLKNTAQQLYEGLLNVNPLRDEYRHPDFFAFKEFCLNAVGRDRSRFSPEKEVAFERFSELIRSNSQAKRFDAPLIWEEIRSIIKGAMPQINIEVLKKALQGIQNHSLPPALLHALQEQFLAFAQLQSLDRIEKFVQKYMRTDLRTFSREIKHFIDEHSDRVAPVIERTIEFLLKERELTQKKYLSFADYEALGKKKAPNFALDRESTYRIFEWYQNTLEREGLWDELDLTREAINVLGQNDMDASHYDIVICDEVQDLTDVQHELLFYVVRNPIHLLFSGDTKQIINPSGFRWEELKRHYYERDLKIPELCFLNLNFRSSGSIVELSNILLELKAGLLGSRAEEQQEDWKYKGRPPVVVQGVSQQRMLESIRSTGAKKTILVRTEQEKKFLSKFLETELVFTINEAKGLEFDTVLLWKFSSDARKRDVWKAILSNSNREVHQAQIRHEINLLYVAITRAQHDLLIYDGPSISFIWESEPIREKIYCTDDMHYIGNIWNVISTPAEWLEQGDYFFEHEYYKAAMECYKNAGADDLATKAKAYAAEKSGDSRTAAVAFEKIGAVEKAAAHYEASGNFKKAHAFWIQVKNEEGVARCYLELLKADGNFSELAEIYLRQQDYPRALKYFVEAREYQNAADLCVRYLNKKTEAARYYEKAGLFLEAATLQRKLKNLAEAAELYEKAKDYAQAEKLWIRLKRQDRLIALYQRTDAHERLLAIYEKSRDFDNAVKVLKKMAGKEDLLAAANELYQKRKYFPALIRYFLARDHLGTANSYFKLKNYAEAARYYELAEDYYEAARAYQKSKNIEKTLISYLKSEEDRQANYASARKTATQVPPKQLYELGKSLRRRKEYELAAFCFKIIGANADAGICYADTQQPEKAYRLWEECLDDASELDELAAYFMAKNEIHVGAKFILSHLESDYSISYFGYWRERFAPTKLLRMMDRYFESHAAEEEMLHWADILAHYKFSNEALDRMFNYFEKCRAYNKYFAQLMDLEYYNPDYHEALERKLRRESRRLVNDISELAAIKLFFLGKQKDFERIAEQLEVDENNFHILAYARQNDQALELLFKHGFHYKAKTILENRSEYSKLASLYEKYDFPAEAAQAYHVARKHLKAAALFEVCGKFGRAGEAYAAAGQFENALEMFRKSGKNKMRIAAMHEKLGSYTEAAKLYQELGKRKKAAQCRAKAGPQLGLEM